MTTPIFSGRDSSQQITNTTTHPVDVPAGNVGDRVVIAVASDGVPTITFPNDGVDWIRRGSAVDDGNNFSGAVYEGIATTTDAFQVTFSTSGSERTTHRTWRFAAYHPDPIEVEASASESVGSTSMDLPAITPSWGQDDIAVLAFVGVDQGEHTFDGFPAGYGNTGSETQPSADSGGCACAFADTLLDDVSSEDPGVFTTAVGEGNHRWIAFTIAVRGPEAGAVVSGSGALSAEMSASLTGTGAVSMAQQVSGAGQFDLALQVALSGDGLLPQFAYNVGGGEVLWDLGELATSFSGVGDFDAEEPVLGDTATWGMSLAVGLSGTGTAFVNKQITGTGQLNLALQASLGGDGLAQDLIPPEIISARLNAAGNALVLLFSEEVQTGAGGNGGWVLTASGGPANLTFSATAGQTLRYTIDRVIDPVEVVTVAYTQPTDGVEDLAGNDLESLAGFPVGHYVPGPAATRRWPTRTHTGLFR